jgi:hypothetical protein
MIKITLEGYSNVNLSRRDLQRRINRHITRCLKEFPEACEGKIFLDGVEHFFVYVVRDGVVELKIAPRELAETILNEFGLSTHEPFNPLPESKRPN